MAPSSLVSTVASHWAKCLFSCTSAAARSSSFLPTSICGRWLSSLTSAPPKRPLNAYLQYILQQRPIVVQLNPEIKPVDVIRKIAQQWGTLSPVQKKPFEEASVKAREQYKVDLESYKAQLSPVQNLQQALDKKLRLTKLKAIRKKRELTSLGKPKRPRTSFNIYMSEHFEEARGATTQGKMKSLLQDWRNLLNDEKQVFKQLAEDDKVRYKNEIKSWEEHMVEIGREDLLRKKTRSRKNRITVTAKKITGKRATSKTKPKGTKKTVSSSTKDKIKKMMIMETIGPPDCQSFWRSSSDKTREGGAFLNPPIDLLEPRLGRVRKGLND